MNLTRRLTQRAQNLVHAYRRERLMSRWVFVVGVDPVAVLHVASHLAPLPGFALLPVPCAEHTDQLANPAAVGAPHAWGLDPVPFTLEAGDVGVRADRVRRQWSRAVPRNTTTLVVADPVNSVRLPWLAQHFGVPTLLVATQPALVEVARLRAQTGLSAKVLARHVANLRAILDADTATLPVIPFDPATSSAAPLEQALGVAIHWQPLGPPAPLSDADQRDALGVLNPRR